MSPPAVDVLDHLVHEGSAIADRRGQWHVALVHLKAPLLLRAEAGQVQAVLSSMQGPSESRQAGLTAGGTGGSTFFMLTPAAMPGRSLPGVVLCEEDLVRAGWLPPALGSAEVRSRRGGPMAFALDVLLTALPPKSEACDPGTGVPGLLTGEIVPDPGSANLDGTPFGSAGQGMQSGGVLSGSEVFSGGEATC